MTPEQIQEWAKTVRAATEGPFRLNLWVPDPEPIREALLAEAAGADAVAAQGMEAGGHRGCFDAQQAERRMVGLCSLVPAVVDAVKIPVIAAGGIADGRSVAAALLPGASAEFKAARPVKLLPAFGRTLPNYCIWIAHWIFAQEPESLSQ